jgi:hypothetical protein
MLPSFLRSTKPSAAALLETALFLVSLSVTSAEVVPVKPRSRNFINNPPVISRSDFICQTAAAVIPLMLFYFLRRIMSTAFIDFLICV